MSHFSSTQQLLMAWEIAERLSTRAAQAGKFWEENANSNQSPLDTIPSVSREFLVTCTALWQSNWPLDRGENAGATKLIQIASSAETKVQMAVQVPAPKFLPNSSDEARKRTLAHSRGLRLAFLGIARRLWMVERTVVLAHRWRSLHSDGVCKSTMEAPVQSVAATSTQQPTKGSLEAKMSLGQPLSDKESAGGRVGSCAFSSDGKVLESG